MKFKEFLRRIIGGRSHSNRLAIFRRWKRYSVRNSANNDYYYPRNITDDEIEKIVFETVEKHTKGHISEPEYKSLAFFISGWRNDVQQQQRKDAAKKRWKKEKTVDLNRNSKK
jgi:SRSO17 transposase